MPVKVPLLPFLQRRRRGGGGAAPGPPPLTNHIVAVSRGVTADKFVVSLATPLDSWGDVDSMLSVSVDGDGWFPAVDIDATDPMNVVFTYGAEHPDAMLWTVPGSDQWHFADEQGLAPPFSGEIDE